MITPLKSLNKAYRRQKVNRDDIERFQTNLRTLLSELNEQESEEHVKNDVIRFLDDTWYRGQFAINTKGRTDLVIHNDKTTKSSAGVLMEVKKPSNKAEMISTKKLNAKALQELVLYYLRERIEHENRDIKHIIITNVYEWFIIDAQVFYNLFGKDARLVKNYREWSQGQKDASSTAMFYKDIAAPAIEAVEDQIEYVHFDLRDHADILKPGSDLKALIPLYKILSPVHLLKQSFANDSNSLNRQFYHELLHIIGLEEVRDGGKKLIRRKEEGKRNEGSLLENAISIMDEGDRLRLLNNPTHFGDSKDERLYNVALELCITWINRVLFLKLLESQLVAYNKGEQSYRFLDSKTVPNFDALEGLFFGVLARKHEERKPRDKEKYAHVPYLNSSLFEQTGLEGVLTITQLNNNLDLDIYSQTVLKDANGKRITGKQDALSYLFAFLEAYDFSSEGKEEIQEESKSLINASVLGLIFEKINGYKDGSFYTPGFITMYMCRETIRRAVVQKFNEVKGWNLTTYDELYNKIEDKKEANTVINGLKICDPAVGSGHFLVSALNEIIAIKADLKILMDKDGKTLRDYDITIENDELIISDDNGELFQYTRGNKEKQRIQKTLFLEKQTIIENCLFGVDINPNSVKICRLRLWIELLKHAFYKQGHPEAGEGNPTHHTLETLPNIDINIKTGNSLISRFPLDADLGQALKSIKYSIEEYRGFVNDYKNATDKEQKSGFQTLINQIKADFRSEIHKSDPRIQKKSKLGGELYNLMNQIQAFEPTEKEKKDRQKKKDKLEAEINKLAAEIEEVKSNKIYENAFEWRFEFPEVLDDAGHFVGFDVVIGNPPYIRQEELADTKPYLLEHYATAAGTADLYVYFVEQAMKLLREKGGFTFILPNKWMRAGYGKNLRSYIKRTKINRILDFGDLPVFEEATTYPAILELTKDTSSTEFEALNLTHLDFQSSLTEYVRDQKTTVLTEELSNQGWSLNDSKIQKLLNKIRSQGNPLGEYTNEKILSGIKTGFNEAFIIDAHTRADLIEKDSKCQEIIKPFLGGRDIKRYKYPQTERWLIFVPWHFPLHEDRTISGASERAEQAFQNLYPSIYAHLLKYKRELENRNKSETGIRYEWYALQRCAASYFEEFDNPKIMLPDISSRCEALYDEEGEFFCLNTAYIIPSLKKSDLGILNSKLILFFYANLTQTIRGGYFRFIRQYLEQIPIASGERPEFTIIEEKVNQILSIKKEYTEADTSVLEAEIDQLVYDLYGLTEEEIVIIERNLHYND